MRSRRTQMTAFVGIAALLAAAPPLDAAPPAPPLEPVVLTAIEIGAVKEAVAERLKDPGSAQFGEMRAARQPGKNAIVCGEVNARNSYGGYVGRRTYTGMLISRDGKAYFAVTGMGSTAAERYAIDTMCQRDGLRR